MADRATEEIAAERRSRNWPTPGWPWATSKTTPGGSASNLPSSRPRPVESDLADADGGRSARSARTNSSRSQGADWPRPSAAWPRPAAGQAAAPLLRRRPLRRPEPDPSPADLPGMPRRRRRAAAGGHRVRRGRFRRAAGTGQSAGRRVRAAREYLLAQRRLRSPAATASRIRCCWSGPAASPPTMPPGGHEIVGLGVRLRADRRRLEARISRRPIRTGPGRPAGDGAARAEQAMTSPPPPADAASGAISGSAERAGRRRRSRRRRRRCRRRWNGGRPSAAAAWHGGRGRLRAAARRRRIWQARLRRGAAACPAARAEWQAAAADGRGYGRQWRFRQWRHWPAAAATAGSGGGRTGSGHGRARRFWRRTCTARSARNWQWRGRHRRPGGCAGSAGSGGNGSRRRRNRAVSAFGGRRWQRSGGGRRRRPAARLPAAARAAAGIRGARQPARQPRASRPRHVGGPRAMSPAGPDGRPPPPRRGRRRAEPGTPLRPGEWHPSESPRPTARRPGRQGHATKTRAWRRNADAIGGSATRRRLGPRDPADPRRLLCRSAGACPRAGHGSRKAIPCPRTAGSIDKFIAAVWEHMDAWGIAGKGMYWRPCSTSTCPRRGTAIRD